MTSIKKTRPIIALGVPDGINSLKYPAEYLNKQIIFIAKKYDTDKNNIKII